MINIDEEKSVIIKNIKDFYEKNGKLTIRDLRVKNGLPNTDKMIKLFGTFQNLLLEANIPIKEENKHNFNRIKLSDEKLLEDLNLFVERHLKTHIYLPTNKEIDADKNIQSCSTYINRFKSFENAYKLIGYNIKQFNNDALEKDMIDKYINMCKDIGYVLNSRDITNLSKNNGDCIYATETYNNHFGTISNLQKMCGFIPTKLGKSITVVDGLTVLRKLVDDIGDIPTYDDINICNYTPSVTYYISEFGSLSNALRKIGLNIKDNRKYRTKDGEEFLSSYEYKFALVMKKFNISYDREIMYKYVINNFKRKFRFDFVLSLYGLKYYIEIFGIEFDDFYNIRKKEKIDICKNNNIPLIDIYRCDLYNKTHKQVYDILLDKINSVNLGVA
jgi:hypothetical protein